MELIQRRPIDSLQRHPENPRLGDVEAIKDSIRRNGWHGVVVAQQSTHYILVGNHRTEAARELQRGQFEPMEGQDEKAFANEQAKWASELKQLPVHIMDCDDDTARRILLADNRTADLATYDDTMLLRLTAQIADPQAALEVLADESSQPDDITEALRVLAKEKASSGRLAGTGYKAKDVEQLALAMEPAGPAEWGSKGAGAVRVESTWEESKVRQLMLPMLVEEFDQVMTVLTDVQEKHGLITNTDAFFWVLAKALPKQFTPPQPMTDEAEGAAPERLEVNA